MKNISPKIILASMSPRRKQLLEQIDLSFDVIPSEVHEDFNIQLSPNQFAMHYAKEKALDLAGKYPNSLVIGADTIVVYNNQILGKPIDKKDSFRMLRMLSNHTHYVVTGVSLQWKNKQIEKTFFEKTFVTFNQLTENDISYYINTYNPLDKAGSYGIQDWFSVCVNKIEGDFYNVMGFPLSSFYREYKKILKIS